MGELNERLVSLDIKSIPVNRKKRNDLKNFEKQNSFTHEKKNWDDIPLDMNVKKNANKKSEKHNLSFFLNQYNY